MNPSTQPREYLNSPKAIHLNLGWACTDKAKTKSAIAYAIHRASIVYKENGDIDFTYQYYKIKDTRNVSVNGKRSNVTTGYGRFNVMFTTRHSVHCHPVTELKTHKGEYVLP